MVSARAGNAAHAGRAFEKAGSWPAILPHLHFRPGHSCSGILGKLRQTSRLCPRPIGPAFCGAGGAFNRPVGTGGSIGIWHETYLVEPGKAESIYVNMPVFGLAAAAHHVKAEGRLA